ACCGPIVVRARSTIRSRVPCSSSTRPASSLDILVDTIASLPLEHLFVKWNSGNAMRRHGRSVAAIVAAFLVKLPDRSGPHYSARQPITRDSDMSNEPRLAAGRVELIDTARVEASPFNNPDLAPVPLSRRTGTTYDFAALWVSMAHSLPVRASASRISPL